MAVKKTRSKSKHEAVGHIRSNGKAKGASETDKSASRPPAKGVTSVKPTYRSQPATSIRTKQTKASVPHKTSSVSPPPKVLTKAAHATAKPSSRTKPALKAKMLSREFLFELAEYIRSAVAPSVKAAKGREVVGSASSGDATFEIDRIAERALITFLRERKLPIAYYSEDAGYTTFSSGAPENLLVVDPIDGTRAAKHGFEGCVVSIASTRVIERPRLCDVENACVMEILGERSFYAERGKGAKVYVDGQAKKAKLSRNIDLELMSWTMTVPARPAELIFPTAAKLIDLTSLKGGFFACNSTSYSLTRLLTNQLDACVDFANRFLRDIPEVVEDQFINAGRGMILGIAPYDIAASVLIAQEAGCVISDAYGRSLDDVMLLDSGVNNHRSLIAAANRELHDKLMSFFETRIKQFERILAIKRRAQSMS